MYSIYIYMYYTVYNVTLYIIIHRIYLYSLEREIYLTILILLNKTYIYMCINIYTRHLKKEANEHDFVSPTTPRFREKSVVMSTEAPLGIGERGLELQNSHGEIPKADMDYPKDVHKVPLDKFRDGISSM